MNSPRQSSGFSIPFHISGLHPGMLVITLAILLSGCSHQPGDDLAVAKIPASQLQATPYLALNDDKPGTPVDVQQYLVPGKYTIVYYYSPYSNPNENFQQSLAQLVQVRQELAVRTVNVNRPEVQSVDWDSPVVQGARLNSIPYFFIFDSKQNLRAHGRPAYEQILQWIRPHSPIS